MFTNTLSMNSARNSKARKIASFNPDAVGNTGANIFGLPFTVEEADVVIIPVPWDVTVSNLDGTAAGPENILEQSPQIDLFDEIVTDPWKAGIAMEDIPQDIVERNQKLRTKASAYITLLEKNPEKENSPENKALLDTINKECSVLTENIRRKALNYLAQEKRVVLLGGDHSTPLGLIQALAEHHPEFGILQIDAHADLRKTYMGFSHSHASIMDNASQLKQVKRIVQVGLRDISATEALTLQNNPEKYHPFFARSIHARGFEGETWRSICHDIISRLPDKVYISFDIDGLDPAQCPSTGTPVPGGLDYSKVLYLFEQLIASGRNIIGFDLVETGPGPSDGIISCRILYKTIALMLKSNHKIK